MGPGDDAGPLLIDVTVPSWSLVGREAERPSRRPAYAFRTVLELFKGHPRAPFPPGDCGPRNGPRSATVGGQCASACSAAAVLFARASGTDTGSRWLRRTRRRGHGLLSSCLRAAACRSPPMPDPPELVTCSAKRGRALLLGEAPRPRHATCGADSRKRVRVRSDPEERAAWATPPRARSDRPASSRTCARRLAHPVHSGTTAGQGRNAHAPELTTRSPSSGRLRLAQRDGAQILPPLHHPFEFSVGFLLP